MHQTCLDPSKLNKKLYRMNKIYTKKSYRYQYCARNKEENYFRRLFGVSTYQDSFSEVNYEFYLSSDFKFRRVSLVTQLLKNPPAGWET